jgi:hypothetical protein
MEEIISTILNNPVFFAISFIVNIFVKIIKDIIEGTDLIKSKGDTPEKGLPTIIFRNFLILLTIMISFGATWISIKLNLIPMIGGSIFSSSIINAVIAIILYEIGIKDILNWIKNKLGIINKDNKNEIN